VHRIGRTGRAGRAGVAVTFVDWREVQRWKLISDTLGLGQPDPLETYSTSEHLYSDLSIPPEAKGTLPRARRDRAGLQAEVEEDLGETGRTRSPHNRDGGRNRTRNRKRNRTRGGQDVKDGRAPSSGAPKSGAATSGDGKNADGVSDEAAPRQRGRRRRRLRGGSEIARDTGTEIIREVPADS